MIHPASQNDPGLPESQIIETARGPIEYARHGDGPPVLLVHGTPGGYDQTLVLSRHACVPGFTYLAPSRPGYLRTPLSVGATPEAQADAYAALLDALNLRSAAVIGISGGGPSALQFALRHPDRCRALALVSALSQPWRPVAFDLPGDPMLLMLMRIQVFALAFAMRRPRLLLALISPDPAQRARIANNPAKLALLLAITASMGKFHLRREGARNDARQFRALPRYPLERITVPALIVHGTADINVSIEHGRFSAATIPHAAFIAREGGDHALFITEGEKVWPTIGVFFQRMCT